SLRWWVRSSHAPSSGPDTRAGNVYALTTRPAAAGLLVRCRASTTTATPTQPSAIRIKPAARAYQTSMTPPMTGPVVPSSAAVPPQSQEVWRTPRTGRARPDNPGATPPHTPLPAFWAGAAGEPQSPGSRGGVVAELLPPGGEAVRA